MALNHLLENNRLWVAEISDHATRERAHRTPTYCWIGCCDGPLGIAPRLGLEPGDLFVYRNLANIVSGSDANGLVALQYAVDVLKVRHIIVCGHSGCRGVLAATSDEPLGRTDHWVSEISGYPQRSGRNGDIALDAEGSSRLCEQNVHAQVSKLCHLRMIRDAWQRGQSLAVHAWMYDDDTGLFRAMESRVCECDPAAPYQSDIAAPDVIRCHEERPTPHDDTTA